eukprot:NODE_9781_length_626_cov_78.184891_g9513_i0.p1 GENE.NODE_9781_length_626_cov_78.184891_g9513_i0~~NODE_9781_length_626_cov_78.184891_g9513_i0.p1  ORF type:complete len:180 (+),score=31.66 NODE_9781_length_626_cov_78.184891_g9513_i0:57-596(+)
MSAVTLASRDGEYATLVEILRDNPALANFKDDGASFVIHGWSPLILASMGGHLDCVKLLIANAADINEFSGSGNTPLLHASCNGDVACVEHLLANGANVNAGVRGVGHTSLMYAASSGNLQCAKALLANGANAYDVDGGGWSALKHAQDAGHQAIVQLLTTRFPFLLLRCGLSAPIDYV